LNHLDVEEMFVFPVVAETHPKEVDALLREHAALRREIGALGLAVDLHTVRRETIDGLCARVREHGEREDALVYTLAEQRLPVSAVRSLVNRVLGAAPRPSGKGRAATKLAP
jgi:hypothetical protein